MAWRPRGRGSFDLFRWFDGMLVLLFKILGGVVAFALGLWIGRPGHARQSHADVEELLEKAERNDPEIDRHFTPLPVLGGKGTSKLRSRRAGFRLRSPEEEAQHAVPVAPGSAPRVPPISRAARPPSPPRR